jgi:hypothetical protein
MPKQIYNLKQLSKEERRQQNRKGRGKGGVKRTRSVCAVVEDAKAILGEIFEEKNDGQVDSVVGVGTRKRRFVGAKMKGAVKLIQKVFLL